ncbi:hypothetical protein [Desulfonatronum thiodismutans]|uniref:hypothetical protein n=1 Tax=Desulfonatronum thiodismutans TaxID=159290 RepID=UPI001268694F|nr:hypothetical protein [Desulfonatronum thiodismutans]
MRSNSPKTWLLTTLMAVLIAVLPSFLQAGQDVRLFVETDEAGGSEPRPSALRQALAQGVAQEAEILMRGELSEGRRAALERILDSRAEEYVLGWEEVEYLPTEWGAVLHLNVRVNREALRDFLRALGTYYTRDYQIGYRFDPQGLVPEQQEVVRTLEQLSGVRDDGSDSLILRLALLSEGGWQGVLDYEGMIWTAAGPDLPEIWAALWGNYFRLDRVRGGFEDAVTLVTQGWRSAGDIQAFDRHLRNLDVSMDTIDLLGVTVQSVRYQANWRIVTMDREALERSLREYFQDQPGTFDLE